MLSVFLYKNRKVLSFILLLLLSFTMMALSSTNFSLNIKAVFLTIIYPFEYVVNGVLDFFKSTWKSIGQLEVIRKELIETRKKLQKYEQVFGDLKRLRQENKKFRVLLKQKENIGYSHILAFIVSKDPQNLYQTIIVDKGSSDGVKIGMPVIAYRSGAAGVVGKIVEVTVFASKIATIREPRFYIGAILASSRYYGLVRGRGLSKICNLKYVDISAPVRLEERVITSGHSDVFPKGLNIGKVIYIDREKGQFFLDARIRPLVDFSTLEEVYILKRLPSKDIRKLTKGMRAR